MKYAFSLLSLASAMLIACTGNSQARLEKKAVLKGARYYVFGIHMVPGRVSDSMYKAYGVKIISASCVLDKEKLALNKQVDSMMLAQHRQSMTEILASVH
jgi:hypothetical protein